jgi:glutamine synthetase type III
MNKINLNVPSIYGELVFTDTELKKHVSNTIYQQFKNSLKDNQKEILSLELANKIANAMKE